MADRIVGFVLCGGAGTRLWPLSRQDRPKQFHDLSGAGPMLARTLQRLKAREQGQTALCVIGAGRHARQMRDVIAPLDLGDAGMILEPVARDTATAVAVAALHTLATFGDSLVLIAPSDHEISSDGQFWESIEAAVPAAEAGRLVVFGVSPTRPETGYGYIEAGPGPAMVKNVLRFVEKPDEKTAAAFLESGRFFWNAGIFLARASTLQRAFASIRPDLLNGARAALATAKGEAAELHLPAQVYLTLPAQSFDRAILERADNISMAPARFSWNDIGSWRSLREIGPTDADGNVVIGDVVAVDCRNSYLRGDGRLLSVVGLDGVAVVATQDAVFVAPLSRSQEVRTIVAQLDEVGRPETRCVDGVTFDGKGRSPKGRAARTAQPTSLRMKS